MDSCEKVSRLMSERMDRDLSAVERLRVGLHLLICRGCRRFGRQLRLLRAASRNLGEHLGDEHRR